MANDDLVTNPTTPRIGLRGDQETLAEWNARVALHEQAHTCTVCGHPLDPAQGMFTQAHAHYDCYRPVMGTVSAVSRAKEVAKAALGLDPSSEPLVRARANGGYLVHQVDTGTWQALCGQKSRTAATRMRQRGRWVQVSENTTFSTCQKCARVMDALNKDLARASERSTCQDKDEGL